MSDIRTKLQKRFEKGYSTEIAFGKGWDSILEDLHEQLMFLDRKYTIVQIKEKYGTLRFYLGHGGRSKNVAVRLMHLAVDHAEYLSAHTCEECGSSSVRANSERGIEYDNSVALRDYGWMRTLCDTCFGTIGREWADD